MEAADAEETTMLVVVVVVLRLLPVVIMALDGADCWSVSCYRIVNGVTVVLVVLVVNDGETFFSGLRTYGFVVRKIPKRQRWASGHEIIQSDESIEEF